MLEALFWISFSIAALIAAYYVIVFSTTFPTDVPEHDQPLSDAVKPVSQSKPVQKHRRAA